MGCKTGNYKPSYALACLALFVAGFLLSSCSTLSGTKLDPAATAPSRDESKPVSGIPYTLSKPQFTLTIAKPVDGATHSTFTLSSAYVPDPTQHYTISPAPGIFSNPDFTINLDGNGTISALTEKTTDTLAPAIVAVGKLAVNALAISATFDEDQGGPPAMVALLAVPSGKNKIPDTCFVPTDLPPLWRMKVDELPTRAGLPKLDEARTNGQLAIRAFSFKDKATLAARFHAITPGEHNCLAAMVEPYQRSLLKQRSDWEDFITTTYPGEDNYFKNTFTTEEQGAISDAVAKSDKKALQKIWGKRKDNDKGDGKALKDKADSLMKQPMEPTKELLISVLNLKFESWKARQVGFLNNRSDHFRQLSISATDIQKTRTYVDNASTIDKQLLATIDDSGLLKRKAELQQFMTRSLSLNLNGRRILAAQEFSLARTELDSVTKQITDLKARYLLALDPVADAPPAQEPGTKTAGLCKKDATGNVAPVDSASKPDYCVVLEN